MQQSQRRIGRSIAAVIVGILAGAVLSLGTDVCLHAIAVFPALGEPMSDRLLLLATAYRTFYSVLSGYITARLAPDRPMKHALVVGGVALVVSLIGALAPGTADWGHTGTRSRSLFLRSPLRGLAGNSGCCNFVHPRPGDSACRSDSPISAASLDW